MQAHLIALWNREFKYNACHGVMEKYIVRNIDSLRRIHRGVTPSIPSHRPAITNWCVVVVAAGAQACFVCCEIEVTHQHH